MGVYSLWDLLRTVSTELPIQALSGKTLAIDASIWLVRANSILSSNDQQKSLNVLKCLFKKIIKLLHFNIRPIFVFDGQPPLIKRKTLQGRRKRRNLSQGNRLQVNKQAQVDLMRLIQGKTIIKKQQQSQSRKRKPLSSNQVQEMNKNFELAFDKMNQKYTIQIAQKVKLQGEILTRQYQFLSEVYPQILQKIGSIQLFDSLQLEVKINAISYIKNSNEFKQGPVKISKQQEQNNSKQDIQILKYMKINQKKTKIRQAQDRLYRQSMVKKQQDGYQVIETIYNGKKVIQKKKIDKQSKNSNNNKFHNKSGKMMNNISDLLNAQRLRQVQQDQQDFQFDQINYQFKKRVKDQNSQEDNQDSNEYKNTDDFLKSLFNKNYNQQQSQFVQLKKEKFHFDYNQKKHPRISLNELKINQNKMQFEDQQYNIQDNEFQIDKKNINLQKHSSQESNFQKIKQLNKKKDNMPDFIYTSQLRDSFQGQEQQKTDLQNLLKIMGIQFIFAKSEAEAECANLQILGIVDGVITQDSDVFLFGAENVYRGVFQNDIKYYKGKSIEQKLGMNRQKFIIFALLLGSDYTDGVKGVGIVNAMQILKVFNTIDRIQKFGKWARLADVLQSEQSYTTQEILRQLQSQCQSKQQIKEQKQFYLLHQRFKNYWHVDDDFPNKEVVEAYLKPYIYLNESSKIKQLKKIIVQKSQSRAINAKTLQKLLLNKFEMSQLQAAHNMKIIMKKHKREVQSELNFINRQYQPNKVKELKSRRLKKAVDFKKQQ